MSNSWKYSCYRHTNTHQEMVANQEEREEGKRCKWGRNSRSQHELDPWTYDKCHNHEKSWKKRRDKQYREESRNEQEEHVVWLEDRLNTWGLEEWFVDHNIAYKIEWVFETRMGVQKYGWCRVCVTQFFCNLKRHGVKNKDGCGEDENSYTYYRYVWDKLPNPKPKSIQYRRYKLTWWSNKNIGIEYVLKQNI